MPMPEDLTDQIAALDLLSSSELRERWTQLFGGPLHFCAHRDLLLRCLAYRLQEQAHGGLARATRTTLRKLAQSVENGLAAQLPAPRIRPGTRLIREWGGHTHEVIVVERGYTYRGGCFKSLSHVARQITGVRRSGPLFFGLKKATPTSGRDANGR